MNKELKSVNITPQHGGYQATVLLKDGTYATSKVFATTDEANEWSVAYADQTEGMVDIAIEQTTAQEGTLPESVMETVENPTPTEDNTVAKPVETQ